MKKKLSLLLCLLICLGLAGCSKDKGAQNDDTDTHQVVSDTDNRFDNSGYATDDTDGSEDSGQTVVDYSSLETSEGFEYSESYIYYANEKIEGYKAEMRIEAPMNVLVIPSEHEGKPIVELSLNVKDTVDMLVVPDTLATLKYISYKEDSYNIKNVWLNGATYPYKTFANIVNAGYDPRNCDENGICLSDDGKVLVRYAPELNKSDDSTTVTVPEGVEVLEKDCFELVTIDCLDAVILPSTLVKIGDYAFKDISVRSVVLPEGVKTIGNSAFEDSGITSINFPEGLKTIGNNAFASCFWLEGDLVIPDSVTDIGYNAFESIAINSLKLGTGLTEIDEDTFSSCDQLTTITVPSNIKELSAYCFGYCDNLESIVIEDGCTKIDDSFRANPKLTSITLPQTLTKMPITAFEGCESLTEVTIPDGTQLYDPRTGSNYCDMREFNQDLKITYRGKVYALKDIEQLLADSLH